MIRYRIILYCLFAGKPSGYDRVRNAEIGNKVRVIIVLTLVMSSIILRILN